MRTIKTALLFLISSMIISAFIYGCSFRDTTKREGIGVPDETNYDERTEPPVNNNANGLQDPRSEEMITIEFTKCMNEEGINTPYPELNPDGSVKWGILKTAIAKQNAGFSWESKKSEKALQHCLPILDDVTSTSPELKGDPVKLQDDLLKLVSCLRNQGFSLTDPDFSEDPRAAMKPIFEEFKAKSSRTSMSTKAEKAFDLCNKLIFQDNNYK